MMLGRLFMSKSNTFAANWAEPPRVKTLITTRNGGYSIDKFSSFNLALHVDDNPEHVLQNRRLLQQQLPDKPYWLNQTHSNRVVNLDLINHSESVIPAQGHACPEIHKNKDLSNFPSPNSEDEFNLETNVAPLEYDASITTQSKKVCVVLTADCLPILVTDKTGSFVAAIHAGWRGVENGVIKDTIASSGSNPQDILAYIGPAICQNHFEVGGEVLEQFVKLDPKNADFFIKNDSFMSYSGSTYGSTSNKYNCDLAGIAKLQLINLGLSEHNIYLSNLCTYCNDDLFYSYRKQNKTGRFASLIWLESNH